MTKTEHTAREYFSANPDAQVIQQFEGGRTTTIEGPDRLSPKVLDRMQREGKLTRHAEPFIDYNRGTRYNGYARSVMITYMWCKHRTA